MTKPSRWSLLALLLCAPPLLWAETVIVSDHLPINVRAPGPQDKIVAAAKSGERLEVLERQKGYLKVRTGKGDEGWVLSRFTQAGPVARERLAAVERARDAAVTRRDELEAALATITAEHQQLRDEHAALRARDTAMQQELERVRRAAASTLDIQQANGDLRRELETLRAARDALQARLDAHDGRRAMLVLGAGILLAGLLMGLIAPLLRSRRPNYSGF